MDSFEADERRRKGGGSAALLSNMCLDALKLSDEGAGGEENSEQEGEKKERMVAVYQHTVCACVCV